MTCQEKVPGRKAALKTVDLMVSIDVYINETNCAADHIQPGTTFRAGFVRRGARRGCRAVSVAALRPG